MRPGGKDDGTGGPFVAGEQLPQGLLGRAVIGGLIQAVEQQDQPAGTLVFLQQVSGGSRGQRTVIATARGIPPALFQQDIEEVGGRFGQPLDG